MRNLVRNHPPLKIPLVREALFEIRFPPSKIPYGIVPGLLFENLKNEFPNPKELPISQFPQEIVPEHMVRHRFLSKDESRMFQIGVGVLSVNHVAYTSFEDFVKDCNDVLEVTFREKIIFSKINRIGLRYINKAPLDRDWNDISRISMNIPDIIKTDLLGQHLRFITRFDQLGELSTTVAWPTVEGSKSEFLTIDLDFFTNPTGKLKQANIIDWIVDAHDIIYKVFRDSLQLEYFSYLQEGQDV